MLVFIVTTSLTCSQILLHFIHLSIKTSTIHVFIFITLSFIVDISSYAKKTNVVSVVALARI